MASSNQDRIAFRRELVSYFWITTLAVFAANFGVDNLKQIIDVQGIFPLMSFSVPFIFFVTLIRFSVGNILHLRELELKNSPAYVWVLDFGVIFLESIILMLLGAYSYGSNFRFFELFLLLSFVDVIWIALMEIKREKRPNLPWSWLILNVISAAILSYFVFCTLYFKLAYFNDSRVICGLLIWFTLCAIIDLFIDHYKLWRANKK